MLEVRNLVKVYKTKKAADVRALDDVSIKFNDTGMVFLLGKSGSGKSTLLNVLGGLDKFDSGEIIIKGKSSKTFSEKDFDAYRNTYLGFIFQEYNILPEFTVQKNISLALELQGKKADKKAIDDLLEQVDLVGYAKRKPNQLSGGQKQRIAIARALIKNPQIIMADEPTGALDSNTGKQVFDTLKKLSKEKLVIVVSHDREFAELYADRIIEMKDGKVLSDVTKRKKAPKALSSGFKIVGRSMIHIDKSHKFSADEAKFLNDVVQSSTSDIIISADPSVNTEIKKLARIDEEGNSEFFDPTNSGDIVENPLGEKLNLIKGRLKFKDSFKMGASGLKTKKIRLFFTILLSAVALAMFGLADTMASFNVIRSNYDSLVNIDAEYLTIAKNHVEERETYVNRQTVNSSKVDLATLREKFPDYTFIPQVELPFGTTFHTIADPKSSRDNLNGRTIEDAFELTKEDFESFGFTILGEDSSFPNTTSRVMITKYQYELFHKYGYNNNGSETQYDANDIKINTVDDIIGKKVWIGGEQFTISGVVDTGIDLTKYQELMNVSENDLYTYNSPIYNLAEKFYMEMTYGFHNSLFFKQGALALFDDGESYKYSYDYMATINDSNSTIYNYALANNEVLADTIFLDSSKTTLGPNEAIIPAYVVYNEFDARICDKIDFYTYYGFEEEKDMYYMNGTSYNTKEEAVSAIANLVRTEFVTYGNTGVIENQYTNSTAEEFKVVGVYIPGLSEFQEYGRSDNVVYFKDAESAPKSIQYLFGEYSSIITKMLHDRTKDFELVSYLSGYDSTEDTLVIKSQVSDVLEYFLDLIETLAQVFLYIGIAFAVFSALLLMNFIAISISYKKQEIGILRALGAKGSDVYGIFLNESLIITFINYIVALVLTIGSTFLINTLMREKLGFYLTLLSFGLRQVILLALVSLIVAIVASFLPTHKVSKMKPIDAIHNRK